LLLHLWDLKSEKIKDSEFNRGGKTAAAPLGAKVLTTTIKFKRLMIFLLKSSD